MKQSFISSIFLLFFFLLTLHQLPLFADILIPPDNPQINYYGRFDFSDPLQPRFNWSGAIIEVTFPGPKIGMRIAHNDAYYDIEIDGMLDTTIHTDFNTREYIFRDDLSEDLHTVRIILRNEGHWGAAIFLGIYLQDDHDLSDAPIKPAQKIEFIGDSHTAGYGIESPGRTCNEDQLNMYTNANLTFAMNVTNAFHAQSIILGWSGAGMVRNYGDSNKRSSDPYSSHYGQTLGAVDDVEWDFTQWIPDLVVINLGTNDYSTDPNPDDSMYIGDYHKFINKILGNYPDAAIICISGESGAFEDNVKRVVSEQNSEHNHPKVYAVQYPSSLALTGCDWHPSIEDNEKIADVLISTIIEQLNWDTTSSATISESFHRRQQSNYASFSAIQSGNVIHLSSNQQIRPRTPFRLLSINGRVLQERKLSDNHSCSFSLQNISPGLYLIGNKEIGWLQCIIRP